MIFLVVGSQKFPFERLIREMDRLKEEETIQDEIVAQIGPSEYIPQNMQWKRFLDKEDFDRHIRTCDLLVTHAGEGSIMTGLLHQRKVIAVPRYAALGEHVSDHQLEIARAFAKTNNLINVENIQDLGQAIRSIDSVPLTPYVSGRQEILRTICDFIG